MPVKHREFLEYLESISCVRQFIVENLELRKIVLNGSNSKDSDKNGEKNDDKNVIQNPDKMTEMSKEDKVCVSSRIIILIDEHIPCRHYSINYFSTILALDS